MQELYYPSFIVRDKNWEKLALLTKESLTTIVPRDLEKSIVNDEYRKIKYETDFYKHINPDSYGICIIKASKDFCTELDMLSKNTKEYSELLINEKEHETQKEEKGKRDKTIELIRKMENMNFELAREKYNDEMLYALENMGFAKCVNGTMMVNEILGTLYMGYLAERISAEDGYVIASDTIKHEEYTGVTQLLFNKNERIRNDVEVSVIEKIVPMNISEIGIDLIIKLRNQPGYIEGIKALNGEIDKLWANKINNTDIILKEIKNINKEMLACAIYAAGFAAGAVLTALTTTTFAAATASLMAPIATVIHASNEYDSEIRSKFQAKKLLNSIEGISKK